AAIHALGIAETIQDPPGGSFERVPGKNIINGRVYEQAQFFLNRYQLTNDKLFLSSLDALHKQALYFGITSIQNMCTGASPEEYVRLLHKTQFPLRLRLIRWGQLHSDRGLNVPSVQLPKKFKELPLVSISGTKWMMDGTPLEWSAAVNEGYKDKPGNAGYMNYELGDFLKMMNDLELRGDQPIFHVVGDKTLSVILDELDRRPKASSTRFRIEHGDGMLPRYFEKAKRNGVMIVQNPTHLAFVSVLHQRWQGEMEKDAYKMKSMLNAGIPVAIGSDGPINPYLNMMLICINPYNPSEALTREDAVIAYTKTAAYAEFEEDHKGTLTSGKVADLVVLSQDIFTVPLEQLPGTSSVLTMVNGKIAYKK
ncbi:MAG: hypothetical protein C0490_26110, partial [Marivirga sp.]|nr:hypothetical protein [Marivirga sp.]